MVCQSANDALAIRGATQELQAMRRRFARGRSDDAVANAVLDGREFLGTHSAEERGVYSADAAADTVLGALGGEPIAGQPVAEVGRSISGE